MSDIPPGEPGPPEAEAASAADGPERSRRRRVAPFIVLGVGVVVAALFVVLAGSSATKSDAVSSFALGKPAPNVVTTTIDGQPFDLSRRKGSWVVLNFFSSTCVPCKAEHPELMKFVQQQAQLGTAGAELYTVINADTDDNVRTWFADNGGGWPVLHDTNGSIAVAFGVAQVPESWVIDPDGIVVAHFPGATDATHLSELLQKLRDQRG